MLLVIGNLFAWLKLTRPNEHGPTLEWKNNELYTPADAKSEFFAIWTDCFSVVPISAGITLLSLNMNKPQKAPNKNCILNSVILMAEFGSCILLLVDESAAPFHLPGLTAAYIA